jgi:hypothetical protein
VIGTSGDRVIGKTRTSPQMNIDYTDQESLGWSGMRSRNLFVFLIEAWGEGGGASPIQVLHSRQRRPLFQDNKVEARDFTPHDLIQLP